VQGAEFAVVDTVSANVLDLGVGEFTTYFAGDSRHK
jgi:hypothetical protein